MRVFGWPKIQKMISNDFITVLYYNIMSKTIDYEFNDFSSIVINKSYFKERFTYFKIICEKTNKICMVAYCSILQKLCFLKVLISNHNSQFDTSVFDILKNISHPNIENIYDIIKNDDLTLILSEYIEGKNLAEYNGILNNQLVKKIINQTYNALNYIHNNNILHGDIKLENIMITNENNIKLIDFDLSKICDNYISSKTLFGSENYIAPESFDLQIYSKRSDIWSFGVSLYKLLLGKFPYIFKPNKFRHMYIRNNFKLLDFKELDKLSNRYDQTIICAIKNMLNFVDDSRPLSIKF